MVISHGYKFIFIHNYKVAGTSVREALQVFSIPPKESYLNWIGQKLHVLPQSSDFPDHVSAPELKAQLSPKYFEKYYKFSFVRNPWDWQVSLYHYARQQKNHHQYEATMAMSFDDYIRWRINEDLHLQKDFMYDKDGKCLVDYIGKMEDMQGSFKHVVDHIGIQATLPHSNKSKHQHYRDYYTDETRKMVEDAFAVDIQLFGYEF